MSHFEACQKATIATLANISLIGNLLEELEDFDSLVEHPVWGSIQGKLIDLKDLYLTATEVLANTEDEEDAVKDILENVSELLKEQLPSILLNSNNRTISINVEVNPTLH